MGRYAYKLTVLDIVQDGADWSTVQPWIIQEFDRETGKILNELLLKRTSPTGRPNWNMSPLHQSKIGAVNEIDIISAALMAVVKHDALAAIQVGLSARPP